MKRNKYRAIKTNGYDSKKESREALELRLLEKSGAISHLEEQPKFELLASFKDNQGKLERGINYIADFKYYDNKKNIWIVKDTKSAFTAKLPVYILKRKLFKDRYRQYIFVESVR